MKILNLFPNKPYDYEVEWLGSNKDAWIDTGISGDATAAYELTMSVSGKSNWYQQYFAGEYSTTFPKLFHYDAKGYVVWAQGTNEDGCIILQQNSYNTIVTIKTENGKIYKDGVLVKDFAKQYKWGNLTVWLFNSHSEPSLAAPMKCYGLKMWSDGVLVRDFIPVVKDNVGYMYDKVSNQLFGNISETGSFTFGKRKYNEHFRILTIPQSYDYEVEWLQSDSNQWIDTGIKPFSKGRFECKVTLYSKVCRFLGSVLNDWNPGISLANPTSSQNYVPYLYGSSWNDSPITLLPNFPRTNMIQFVFEPKNQQLYVDGQLHSQSQKEWVSAEYGNILMFRSQHTQCLQKVTFYNCRIYNDTTLVRDFIPVVKDGVGYMYDKVSKSLFKNQGEGVFEFGPKVIRPKFYDCL